jgi:hypothetical protein
MVSIMIEESEGRELYYEDTGPPSAVSAEYLTIFLIHGLGINGGKWATCDINCSFFMT